MSDDTQTFRHPNEPVPVEEQLREEGVVSEAEQRAYERLVEEKRREWQEQDAASQAAEEISAEETEVVEAAEEKLPETIVVDGRKFRLSPIVSVRKYAELAKIGLAISRVQGDVNDELDSFVLRKQIEETVKFTVKDYDKHPYASVLAAQRGITRQDIVDAGEEGLVSLGPEPSDEDKQEFESQTWMELLDDDLLFRGLALATISNEEYKAHRKSGTLEDALEERQEAFENVEGGIETYMSYFKLLSQYLNEAMKTRGNGVGPGLPR